MGRSEVAGLLVSRDDTLALVPDTGPVAAVPDHIANFDAYQVICLRSCLPTSAPP